jgi:glycosyltransferase involved in cell wall biosynthesis
LKIAFLTSTPLSVAEGSGTFTGIYRLARSLRRLGCDVELMVPERRLPIHTLERLWFNERIDNRRLAGCDAVVGFDMDGYRLPRRAARLHVASIKGVVADEARFERGATRWTMSVQALCEGIHVRRADLVMTTSLYAAGRIRELYRFDAPVSLVPEMIDLARWRRRFAECGARQAERFTVLTVCRLFPRKRVGVLLEAARMLRERIPGLEVRIVGDGPEGDSLRRRWRDLGLRNTVTWLGVLPPDEVAAEYSRAHVFCLPSVQEGFGIVFLEAMAAGKPIVAARAAAVPEVVPQGLLVRPDDEEALAAGIEQIYRDPNLRRELARAGRSRVEEFDAPRVATRFLEQMRGRSTQSPITGFGIGD